jgi:hypothetical protein
MSARVSKRAFTLGVVLLLCGLLLFLLWAPMQIQYHRSFVQDSRGRYQEPTTWRERFSVRWLRWGLAGRPDTSRQMEPGRQHEEALISLGYFERRTFPFSKNRDFRDFVNAVHDGPLKDPLCYFRFDDNETVEVIAHQDDFPRMNKLLEEYGVRK